MTLPRLPQADLMTQVRHLKSLPEYSTQPVPSLLRLILAYRQSGLLVSTTHLNFGKIPAFQRSVRFFYITMRRGEKYSPNFEILPRGVAIYLEKRGDLIKVRVQISVYLGDFRGSVQIISPHERKIIIVSAVGEASVENMLLECSMNDLEATWGAAAAAAIQETVGGADDDVADSIETDEKLDLQFVDKINRNALSAQQMLEYLAYTYQRVAQMYGMELEAIKSYFRYERRGSVEKMIEQAPDSLSSSSDGSKRRWDGVGEAYCGSKVEISVEYWFIGLAEVFGAFY